MQIDLGPTARLGPYACALDKARPGVVAGIKHCRPLDHANADPRQTCEAAGEAVGREKGKVGRAARTGLVQTWRAVGTRRKGLVLTPSDLTRRDA